jgi:hypothetical protein
MKRYMMTGPWQIHLKSNNMSTAWNIFASWRIMMAQSAKCQWKQAVNMHWWYKTYSCNSYVLQIAARQGRLPVILPGAVCPCRFIYFKQEDLTYRHHQPLSIWNVWRYHLKTQHSVTFQSTRWLVDKKVNTIRIGCSGCQDLKFIVTSRLCRRAQ